jgi:hypothetical protein
MKISIWLEFCFRKELEFQKMEVQMIDWLELIHLK